MKNNARQRGHLGTPEQMASSESRANVGRWASRVDMTTHIREDVGFFGPPGRRMFGCTHLPLHAPSAGVVVCSPVQAEFLRNYRREVLLARSLAARGIAVQRFHFRGAGNSDGDSSEATFETMCQDALDATQMLIGATGVADIAFVGTRVGGLVAASIARNHPGVPLVLVAPAVDLSAYFREIFRGRLVSELKEVARGRQKSSRAPMEELRQTGMVDILGYPIHRALFDSIVGRSLVEEVGEGPRPILVVQVGKDDRVRRQYAALMTRWRESGFAVDSLGIDLNEPWWFGGGVSERRVEPIRASALIEGIGHWLLGQLSS